MKVQHIDIGKVFSTHLGPRERRLGEASGEALFELLLPAYESADLLVVELDGIEGYTPSCLDEAFGGLVTKFTLAEVQKKLRLKATTNAFLLPMIEGWMNEAEVKRRSRRG